MARKKFSFSRFVESLERASIKYPLTAAIIGTVGYLGGRKAYRKMKRRSAAIKAAKRDKKMYKDPQYYDIRMMQDTDDMAKRLTMDLKKTKRVPKVRQKGSGNRRSGGRPGPKTPMNAEQSKLARELEQYVIGEYRGPGIRRAPKGRYPTAEYVATRGVIGGISRALETGSSEAAQGMRRAYADQLKRRMSRARRAYDKAGLLYMGEIAPRKKGEFKSDVAELAGLERNKDDRKWQAKEYGTLHEAAGQVKRGFIGGLISTSIDAIQDKMHRYPWFRSVNVKIRPDVLERELKIRGIVAGDKTLKELSLMIDRAMSEGRQLTPVEMTYLKDLTLRTAQKKYPSRQWRKPTKTEELKQHREAKKTIREVTEMLVAGPKKVPKRKSKIPLSRSDKERIDAVSRSVLSAKEREKRLKYIKARWPEITEERFKNADDLAEQLRQEGYLPEDEGELFEGVEGVHKSIESSLRLNKNIVSNAFSKFITMWIADSLLFYKQIAMTPVQGVGLAREDLHGGGRKRKKKYQRREKSKRVKKDVVAEERTAVVNDILKFDVGELKGVDRRYKGHRPEDKKGKKKSKGVDGFFPEVPAIDETIVSSRSTNEGLAHR